MASSGRGLQPLQLVAERDGRYEVGAAAAAFLSNLTEPLAVVVVGGRFRTGKSFLLNRCVLRQHGKTGGFCTGSTVNACTKGIWLHPQLLAWSGDEGGKPTAVVVLDTEGTQSLEASPEQDAKLLSLALLLASVFVFNSTGSVDEAALADLGVVASIAGLIRGDELWDTPDLVWALRDFALCLEDQEGRPETPDAYLERSLATSVEGTKAEARSLLRSFFQRRCLFPFVRPVLDEGKLQKLNVLPDKDLRPEFQEQARAFSKLLADRARKPKTIGGQPVTGPALARLCSEAVAAVNAGATPRVADAYVFLLEGQLRTSLDALKAEVGAKVVALQSELPLPPEELKLPEPATPKVLRGSETFAPRFRAARREAVDTALEELARRNDAEKTRWLREQMEEAGRCEEDPAAFLERFVATAPGKVGAASGLQALRLLLSASLENLSRKREAVTEALKASRSELSAAEGRAAELSKEAGDLRRDLETARTEARRAREDAASAQQASAALGAEAAELREQLEAHLLAPPPAPAPEGPSEEELELRELLRAALASREAAEATARDLASALSSAEDRVAAAESAAMSAEARAVAAQEGLAEAERVAEAAADAARSTSAAREADAASRLEALKAEMLERLVEAHRRHSEALAAAQGQAEASGRELEATRAAQQLGVAELEEARQKADAAEKSRADLRAEQAKELQDLRRANTEALAERAKMLRESYEQTLQECRQARERAAAVERSKIRLEIDNESLKRSLEASGQDVEQLQKSRRLHDELREQLGQKEAQLRSQTALADDLRLRQARQDERHARQEQALNDLLREKDYRIALLEVELKAKSQ